MRDMLGNVAELGTANIFMAKDGVVYTPAANGTFLNGITRQRVIKLLREDGASVVEKTMSYADFQGADEIFSVRQLLPSCRRSPASTSASCSPVRSTARRASSTGRLRIRGSPALRGVLDETSDRGQVARYACRWRRFPRRSSSCQTSRRLC